MYLGRMGRPKKTAKRTKSRFRKETPAKPKVTQVEIELAEEETTQVAFRLSAGLLAALDTEAKLLRSRTPGVTFTRADAMRSILSAYNADPVHVEALRKIDEVEQAKIATIMAEQERRDEQRRATAR